MNIALATCEEKPEGIADDLHLIEALKAAGHVPSFAIWNSIDIDWSQFDLCLIRTTFDYHRQLDQFLSWADAVAKRTRLVNPFSTLRWNSSKQYLLELAQARVPVVPSSIFDNGPEALDAASTLLRVVGAIVVKPTVSASAELTFRISNPQDLTARIHQALERGPILLQPHLRSVESDGEASLIYFRANGQTRFSHAVVKRPVDGDFRVQMEFGGTAEVLSASPTLIELGLRVLQSAPEFNYARVDFLDWKSSPRVGEIELIEPELFFRYAKDAAAQLVSALTE